MQYDSKIPIYLQVIKFLKTDIISGQIKCGQKLPSSRELAVTYTINPNTAARVYQELEREGVCYTKRGMGTFVTEDEGVITMLREQMAEEALDVFLKSMSELGISIDEAVELLKQREE
ncbi:DNA-binding transcriptional regulator YhcF, GntR family [Pseudobutyrivibrio sp. OR37]|uniref:GntR family transcriptional regulator n=1 Tax=Pseudobutyrivibrio sp. OR37 TaxID=1798186 RepID=UPI0008ED4391|nr:GntR family transcriptional regulator [Pseudobutyrivibrio sp. OR37]SFI14267.1 DNA-binding transcriptional regulator YhcF, GntR family [Pseudobutyrivibrio sp. OR37]